MSKFTWEPEEKLVRADAKVENVFDRLKREGKLGQKWPEDFRGFGTNVKPKKQR